uniref:Uncharacterized protein n=1 Tax=Romanomermis culicivorax TaxID=13658 RepID=A0A915JS63_ROMCU
MLVKIVALFFASAAYALDLEDARPGAIPTLFREAQSGTPGAYQKVTDAAEKERIKTYINDNIKKLESKSGRLGGVHHRLLDLHDTIEQQVQGKNIKVVFDVAQMKASAPQTVDENGQYGQCYFKLHLPLNANEATLQEHTCIKITKDQLGHHHHHHHQHGQ